MTDEEFEDLKKRLNEVCLESETLQALYRRETGQRYQPPFFLGWKGEENGKSMVQAG